jgi:hypothetical protein
VQQPHRTIVVHETSYCAVDVAAASVSVTIDGVPVFTDTARHPPSRATGVPNIGPPLPPRRVAVTTADRLR